jgi:transposase
MNNRKVTFKEYNMQQPSLLPPSLEELIPEHHLVRVVNRVVDELDISPLLAKYKGGGTSSYHPRMMLKVIVYAYSQKIYSSRKIEKALWENIGFMWISGGNRPDFHTLNNFRSETMKEAVRKVFASLMEFLVEEGYVKMENYFVDGTKVGANSNPHKVVWAKKTKRYKEKLQQQIEALLDEIERVNEEENEAYGEENLEELGEKSEITAEKVRKQVDELNQRLREAPQDKTVKKAVKTLEEKHLPRLQKYEEQERLLDGRNSYSKTDPDASSLRMKEDRAARKPLARPAYNVQMGTEAQFVVGYSIHQQADDTSCFIPHLQQQIFPKGRKFKNGSGDAGYGSEENYAFLEQEGMGNFFQYNTFHQEQHPPRKPEALEKLRFKSTCFPYDQEKDEFSCPAHKRLVYLETRPYKSKNGYLSQRRFYECFDCATCPLKPNCTKAQGNRRMQVSFELQRYRQQAQDNLLSEQGLALRQHRSTEPETVFGDIKHNMQFRRFMLKGLKKVDIEWGLLCMAHNLRKLAIQ